MHQTGLYPTAVSQNDALANECKPVGKTQGFSKISAFITPVPMLSELVVSERYKKICLVMSEAPFSNEKMTAEHFKINKGNFVASYGTLNDGQTMRRMFSVPYDFAKTNLEPANIGSSLHEFYFGLPRAFSPENQTMAIEFHSNIQPHFESFLRETKSELDEKVADVRFYFNLTWAIGTLILSFFLRTLVEMYKSYQEDMYDQERSTMAFRDFIFATDVIGSQRASEDYWRAQRATASQQRQMQKKGAKSKPQPKPEKNTMKEETEEQREARRSRKLKAWCAQLRELTPPLEMATTERICNQAMETAGFEEAKNALASAIEKRKFANKNPRAGVAI